MKRFYLFFVSILAIRVYCTDPREVYDKLKAQFSTEHMQNGDGFFRQQIQVAHDTAADLHGICTKQEVTPFGEYLFLATGAVLGAATVIGLQHILRNLERIIEKG